MYHIKTLSALQNITTAYNDFISMKNLKEEFLSNELQKELPDFCKCGSEFIMTSSFTEPQCTDPYCPYKMAYTLSYFIKQMGFKNFGDETCKILVLATYETFEYPSFLCAFSVDENTLFSILGQADANNFLDIKETLLHTPYRFSKTFPALGIPGFGVNCKLMSVLKSPNDLVHLLATGEINNFLDKIGMYAPAHKFYLDAYAINISLLYSKYAPLVIMPGKREMYIAVTGNVTLNDTPMTRTEFLHICASLTNSEGEPMYDLKESKSKTKLSYVIADQPSASEKYAIGKELNCIVTANEFFNILKDGID